MEISISATNLNNGGKIFAIIMTLPYNEIPANKSKLYPYPSNLNHVAVSVTNIEDVIAWYTKVLGFDVVKPPFEAVAEILT